MTYQKIDVQPLAGAPGAEIHGADLARPPDNHTFCEMRRVTVIGERPHRAA